MSVNGSLEVGALKEMSLRRRTIIAVATSLLAMIALLVTFSQTIVRSGFESVERRDATLNVNRVRDAFAQQVESISVKIADWSMWDDAYRYMGDGNADFEASSLITSALWGMKIDIFVWRHPDGRLRWGRQFDPAKGEALPLDPALAGFFAEASPLFTFQREDDRKAGIVDLPVLGPTFLAVHPIVTSTGAGPIRGALIAGRAINSPMLEQLRKLTHLDLALKRPRDLAEDPVFQADVGGLLRPTDVNVRVLNEQTIAGYTMIPDAFDKPVAYVRVAGPREIYAQGRMTIYQFLGALALAGLVFGLVFIFVIEHNVVSRVVQLSTAIRRVRQSADLSLRVPVTGRDELTQLAAATNAMLDSIERAQRDLARHNRDMRLILDNAEQGFLNVGLDGRIFGDRSAIIDTWLGAPESGVRLCDFIHAGDPKRAQIFAVGWEQVVEDILPFDIAVDQLPCRFKRGADSFLLKLRPVHQDGKLSSVLAVVSNITELIKAEVAEREQRESMRVFQNVLIDRGAVNDFFRDTAARVDELVRGGLDRALQMRSVHTLKGNAAQQGLESFARICHELESKLIDDASAQLTAEDLAAVKLAFGPVLARFQPLLEGDDRAHVKLARTELEDTVQRVESGQALAAVAGILRSWQLEPIRGRFARLGRVAESVAQRLGKGGVKVSIDDGGIRADMDPLTDFWANMVHVIRNAIDHGIEPEDVRLSSGKPANGTVALSATAANGALVLAVIDDGQGIDWEAIRTLAAQKGLPHQTQEDLVAALFSDGVSTKQEVTEVSGRGVGMAAVRQVVLSLGGRIEIDTQRGRGTTFRFVIPGGALSMMTAPASIPTRLAS